MYIFHQTTDRESTCIPKLPRVGRAGGQLKRVKLSFCPPYADLRVCRSRRTWVVEVFQPSICRQQAVAGHTATTSRFAAVSATNPDKYYRPPSCRSPGNEGQSGHSAHSRRWCTAVDFCRWGPNSSHYYPVHRRVKRHRPLPQSPSRSSEA